MHVKEIIIALWYYKPQIHLFMNDYQTARSASIKLIVKEAKSHPEALALIPKFSSGISRLEAISTEIDAIGILQGKDITGIASDKNTLIDLLSNYLVDISGAVCSHAIEKNDKTLQAKATYKQSAVGKMSQAELLTAAGIIQEEAGKISAEELANEGISAEEMAQFSEAYAKLNDTFTGTREAIIDRSGYTQKLADLFAEASAIKKNILDPLSRQYQRKAPEFYQKYKAASTVIYKRNTKESEEAKVEEASK